MTGLVTTIEKNKTEEIRISLSEYKGTKFIDIRLFWLKSDDEILPTRKGISLDIEKLDELISGLENARQVIAND